ncbi:MAG TPA: hypothetical protein VJ961_03150, partial [Mariprofundaceae bacterium]|nr:hypothetical protein [Mariprofundaceae bacterium]
VKLLQMRDEQDELDGAIEAGRQALSGDDLARFESEVALLGAEGADEADTSTDETPATESVDLDEELSADFSVAGEARSDEGDTDIPTVGVSAGDESEETVEVDLSDTAGGDDSGLDMGELDWSPFGEPPGHEETPEETAPESPEMETDTDLTAATDSGLSMDEVRGGEADAEHDDVDGAADSVEEPNSDASDLGGLEGGLDFDDAAVEEPDHAEEVSSSVEEGTDEAAETPPAREEGEAIDLDLSSLMLDETGDEEERAGTEEAATSEPDDSGDDHDVSSELDSLLDELGVDADMDAPKSDDGVTAGSLAIDMARSLVARGELDDAETAFKSALEGDFRCQGLLGMAEVAQQRGDAATADEMLAQAEPLLGDDTREWFETLKEKQGE